MHINFYCNREINFMFMYFSQILFLSDCWKGWENWETEKTYKLWPSFMRIKKCIIQNVPNYPLSRFFLLWCFEIVFFFQIVFNSKPSVKMRFAWTKKNLYTERHEIGCPWLLKTPFWILLLKTITIHFQQWATLKQLLR